MDRSQKEMLLYPMSMLCNKITLNNNLPRKWLSNLNGQQISPRHIMSLVTHILKSPTGVLPRYQSKNIFKGCLKIRAFVLS